MLQEGYAKKKEDKLKDMADEHIKRHVVFLNFTMGNLVTKKQR